MKESDLIEEALQQIEEIIKDCTERGQFNEFYFKNHFREWFKNKIEEIKEIQQEEGQCNVLH